MSYREIRKNVFFVGAIDRDRRLFDELIPLPDGTTYNSYLIRGSEKTALLDSVDPPMVDVPAQRNVSLDGGKKVLSNSLKRIIPSSCYEGCCSRRGYCRY